MTHSAPISWPNGRFENNTRLVSGSREPSTALTVIEDGGPEFSTNWASVSQVKSTRTSAPFLTQLLGQYGSAKEECQVRHEMCEACVNAYNNVGKELRGFHPSTNQLEVWI